MSQFFCQCDLVSAFLFYTLYLQLCCYISPHPVWTCKWERLTENNIYPMLLWCSFIIQSSMGLLSCRWKPTLPFFFPPVVCLLYLRQKPQENWKDIISKTSEKNVSHVLWVNLLYIWSCGYLILYVPGTICFWTVPHHKLSSYNNREIKMCAPFAVILAFYCLNNMVLGE